MTVAGWALLPLRKYATFSGRAPRPEYWWFYLMCVTIVLVGVAVDAALGLSFGEVWGPVSVLSTLLLVIPSLAVTIRRLHDTDRSGWWSMLSFVPLVGPLILLVFLASAGTPGNNRFG